MTKSSQHDCQFIDRQCQGLTNVRTQVHWIPYGQSEVVSWITRSMATRNKIRERIQPCHTSELMKSMKFINKEWFHSIHCSMLLRRPKTWSMQPRPLWNPAYSCLNFESMALSILTGNLKRCYASPVFTIILLRSPIFEILNNYKADAPAFRNNFMVSDLSKDIRKSHLSLVIGHLH